MTKNVFKLIFLQRMRFKKIASVAATRVESMRDLLIRYTEFNISVPKYRYGVFNKTVPKYRYTEV